MNVGSFIDLMLLKKIIDLISINLVSYLYDKLSQDEEGIK